MRNYVTLGKEINYEKDNNEKFSVDERGHGCELREIGKR